MYDYVVVGGGSAGCVVAARLAEDPAVRVCLVEAGPPDDSELVRTPVGAVMLVPRRNPRNWAFETVPQRGLGGRRGYQPRGRTLGGSSSINAMIYVRGDPSDFDGWAAQGAAGWSWQEVLPYFVKSEDNARGADAFHGAGGPLHVSDLVSPNPLVGAFLRAAESVGIPRNPDFNAGVLDGAGPYQVTQKNGRRWSAARAFLAPPRANLDIRTGVHVTRVVFDGRRAVGIEGRAEDGRVVALPAAREVVLSAGALQSPQLLMLSGIGPGAHLREHGIEVLADLPGVGANLHDHVDYVLGYRTPRREPFGISAGGVLDLWRDLREYRRQRTGRFTSNFAEVGAFVRTRPDEPAPDVQLYLIVAMVDDHARRLHLGHGYSMHICVSRPKSRGTLRLASADPFAAPVIDPDFLGHPDDIETMLRGFRIGRRLMQSDAFASYRPREMDTAGIDDDDGLKAVFRRRADTIYHPVGTCRMGIDADAVVDPSLRVHGVEGLRVADASVMPTLVTSNTNAAAIMIGEKAADLVRADAG